jgi:hypothetical protein
MGCLDNGCIQVIAGRFVREEDDAHRIVGWQIGEAMQGFSADGLRAIGAPARVAICNRLEQRAAHATRETPMLR